MNQHHIDELKFYLDSAREHLQLACVNVVDLQSKIAKLKAEKSDDDLEKVGETLGHLRDIEFLYHPDRLTAHVKPYAKQILAECHTLDFNLRGVYDEIMAYPVYQTYMDIRCRIHLLLCDNIAQLVAVSPTAACSEFETIAKSILDKAKEISKR